MARWSEVEKDAPALVARVRAGETHVIRLRVPAANAGERIDRYLALAVPGFSRSRIGKLIEEGRVSLGGACAKASARLSGGEEIVVDVPPVRPLVLAPEDLPLDVLFEDPHLLVVCKPAGMVVHPAPGHPGSTLVNALLSRAGGLSGIGGVARPGIVHRPDKDTSGILVVAKTDRAHEGLSAQLSAHRMDRRYHGIVWGAPPAARGTVSARVGRHPVHRKKMAVLREGGRHATTHYRLLEAFGPFSLLEFRLETGRTHQIRLHCAHLGCPVRWVASADLFMCPCHGGVFYKDGRVASGPPPRTLATYPVRVRDGTVEILASPLPITG